MTRFFGLQALEACVGAPSPRPDAHVDDASVPEKGIDLVLLEKEGRRLGVAASTAIGL